MKRVFTKIVKWVAKRVIVFAGHCDGDGSGGHCS